MDYLKVGNIINTFGIKGELKVESLTDFEQERFQKDQTLFVEYQHQYVPVKVSSYRLHKGFVLLALTGLDNINLVEKYKGCCLYVAKKDLHPLKQGQYYFFQLMDCDVYHNGERIGQVTEVQAYYQVILRVQTQQKEVLIPFVDCFIQKVDLENKRIDVQLIEGML